MRFENLDTSGWFWLSSDPEARVPGRLLSVDNDYRLDLDGILVDQSHGTGDSVLMHELEGLTREGPLLLAGCHVQSTQETIGAERLSTQRLRCRGVSDRASSLVADEIWIEFQGLEQLLSGLDDLPLSRSDFLSADTNGELLAKTEIDGLGGFEIRTSVSGIAGSERIDLHRSAVIVVRLDAQTSVAGAATRIVAPLQAALEVLGQVSLPLRFCAWSDSRDERHKLHDFRFVTGFERPPPEGGQLPQTMLSWQLTVGDFMRYLTNWMNGYSAILPVVGPLLSHDRQGGTYVEWRMQSAAVATEEAYCWLEGVKKKPDFRPMVRRVIEHSGWVGEDVVSSCPDFERRFAKARNAALHSSGELRGAEGHYLGAVMRTVISAALFLCLTGPSASDPTFTQRNTRYSSSREWLRDRPSIGAK